MNKNYKIYLVEDDEFFAATVCRGLEVKGYRVIHFQDGESMLKMLRKSRPDMIILDYHLDSVKSSALTGGQIMEILNARYSQLPVIMLTSDVKIDNAVEIIRLGALDYITKNRHFFFNLVETIDNIFEAIELKSEMETLDLAVRHNRIRVMAITAMVMVFFIALMKVYGIF